MALLFGGTSTKVEVSEPSAKIEPLVLSTPEGRQELAARGARIIDAVLRLRPKSSFSGLSADESMEAMFFYRRELAVGILRQVSKMSHQDLHRELNKQIQRLAASLGLGVLVASETAPVSSSRGVMKLSTLRVNNKPLPFPRVLALYGRKLAELKHEHRQKVIEASDGFTMYSTLGFSGGVPHNADDEGITMLNHFSATHLRDGNGAEGRNRLQVQVPGRVVSGGMSGSSTLVSASIDELLLPRGSGQDVDEMDIFSHVVDPDAILSHVTHLEGRQLPVALPLPFFAHYFENAEAIVEKLHSTTRRREGVLPQADVVRAVRERINEHPVAVIHFSSLTQATSNGVKLYSVTFKVSFDLSVNGFAVQAGVVFQTYIDEGIELKIEDMKAKWSAYLTGLDPSDRERAKQLIHEKKAPMSIGATLEEWGQCNVAKNVAPDSLFGPGDVAWDFLHVCGEISMITVIQEAIGGGSSAEDVPRHIFSVGLHFNRNPDASHSETWNAVSFEDRDGKHVHPRATDLLIHSNGIGLLTDYGMYVRAMKERGEKEVLPLEAFNIFQSLIGDVGHRNRHDVDPVGGFAIGDLDYSIIEGLGLRKTLRALAVALFKRYYAAEARKMSLFEDLFSAHVTDITNSESESALSMFEGLVGCVDEGARLFTPHGIGGAHTYDFTDFLVRVFLSHLFFIRIGDEQANHPHVGVPLSIIRGMLIPKTYTVTGALLMWEVPPHFRLRFRKDEKDALGLKDMEVSTNLRPRPGFGTSHAEGRSLHLYRHHHQDHKFTAPILIHAVTYHSDHGSIFVYNRAGEKVILDMVVLVGAKEAVKHSKKKALPHNLYMIHSPVFTVFFQTRKEGPRYNVRTYIRSHTRVSSIVTVPQDLDGALRIMGSFQAPAITHQGALVSFNPG